MRKYLALVSNEKGFSHPVVGSARLNRLGLHTARVVAAGVCSRVRSAVMPSPDQELARNLGRDGFVIIADLLPPALYAAARAEFSARLAEHEREVPRPLVQSRGFGPRLPNARGFDRADGGSLNRFLQIDARSPALREAFNDNAPLRRLLRALTGTRVTQDAFSIYQLVHGDEQRNPDLQREVHCDTFHDTFKLWYFFDPVTEADGPLMYSPGTHRSDARRRAWEMRRVVDARVRSSAFRATSDDLREMGLPAPRPLLAPANSLILANTRGFHCRGLAPAGTVRQGIHAGLRPRAFSLWAAAD